MRPLTSKLEFCKRLCRRVYRQTYRMLLCNLEQTRLYVVVHLLRIGTDISTALYECSLRKKNRTKNIKMKLLA